MKSPQRDTHLKQIQIERGNEDSNVHPFCPTWCSIHGQTPQPILDKYKELMELCKWSLSVVSETEMKARIWDVQNFMGKFVFLFGCQLGKLLSQTDNLSKTIQKPVTSAVEAQSLAKSILTALVSDQSDENFQVFRERIQLSKVDLDVNDSQVSRKRKVPSRFESDKRESYYYHENPKDKYKQVYYEAFDRVIACIREGFLLFTNKNVCWKMLLIVPILSLCLFFLWWQFL